MLVFADPGSGKTRVLVHRIAFLVRARRALTLARFVESRPTSSPGAGWRDFDFVREPPD